MNLVVSFSVSPGDYVNRRNLPIPRHVANEYDDWVQIVAQTLISPAGLEGGGGLGAVLIREGNSIINNSCTLLLPCIDQSSRWPIVRC